MKLRVLILGYGKIGLAMEIVHAGFGCDGRIWNMGEVVRVIEFF